MKLRQKPYNRRSNIDTQPKWYKAVSCILGSELPGSQDKKGNMINYKYAGSWKNQRNECGLFWSRGLWEQSPQGPEGGDTVQHRTAVTLKGSALLKYRFLAKEIRGGASESTLSQSSLVTWMDALMWALARMGWPMTLPPTHPAVSQQASDCTVLSQLSLSEE